MPKILQQLPEDFLEPVGSGECSISSPTQLSVENSLDEIFVFARQQQASDIHISANNPIILRKFSKLIPVTEAKISKERIQKIIEEGVGQKLLSEFLECGDLEFVHSINGAGRYRVTLMKQRFGWDLTARVIAQSIRSFEDSGMPASCQGLTKWAQGLVLVTGPAGCGKTSSLATLVELINATRNEHIITIENPIEMIYESQKCQITQRQIDRHTLSQENALKAALREDPDILVISELRDLASIQLAVTAAETGHLVFGTMNTNNASQTISRLIDSFPPDEQAVIQNMISESLRGVICQQLIPKKDGSGVVPAFEILVVNMAVANMIRLKNIQNINNLIATGKNDGMVLIDASLSELVNQGIIDKEEARQRAINPKLFS